MKRKLIDILSNGTLIIGAILALYVIVDIYLLKRNLPSGVCPITDNKPVMYTAIAFCCISFILSFFSSKAKEEEDRSEL